jgi:effector-binding domain-containing protein
MPEAEPAVVTLEPVTTAVIRRVVPMDRLPEFFDGSFGALAAAVQEQDAGVAGPAFAFYHRLPTDTADLEVGFPTRRAVTATGDVRAASLPAGRVARVVHAGSFDGLGPAWERLRGWMDAQGLRAGETFWEVYLTEPTPDMDPAELRTELNWPVAD